MLLRGNPVTGEVYKVPYDPNRLSSDLGYLVLLPPAPTLDQLAEWGIYEVYLTSPPNGGFTHKAIEVDPVYTDGQWVQTWELIPLSQVEAEVAVGNFQTYIVNSTQERLDTFAKTRGYDGILSACTYASSTIPKFAGEGQCCVNIRDATWAALYQLMNDVQTAVKPAPASWADVEAVLPALVWP